MSAADRIAQLELDLEQLRAASSRREADAYRQGRLDERRALVRRAEMARRQAPAGTHYDFSPEFAQ